ncbi:concanavalin A-like lectin/glucanase domain-containing protein [Blyttiomyces helicus]|uniref:Concanavalin A-like lectin/glucanase domain-containing protein n=1 Tax=Blyttiomyces helicus TaxID=388810 RepID=A0A4P9W082_9FUNG|nr:concanavalin A-like lectin/glucanase domain-containing protein [Blyttiomyces helicus]|eukprot:RKO85519.1 concanavalin A-like lectin/glucanase domain-containing protein [Blyttiomyces helicus]
MRIHLLTLIGASAVIAAPTGPRQSPASSKSTTANELFVSRIQQTDECLLFEDDFNTLRNTVWQHTLSLGGGGNFEFEYYTNNRSNSFVRDGTLYLQPTLTVDAIGQANLDGSVDPVLGYTMDLCLKYGRVEVRAKLPQGDWIWPAIWMLPVSAEYGSWPASGEIDIMESRGNVGYPAALGGGPETIGSTLHWGPSADFNRFLKTHQTWSNLPPGETFADDFHVFGLEWTEDGITTFVDNSTVLNVQFNDFWTFGNFPSNLNNPWEGSNAAPFDQEFYLLMNVAVGGSAGGYWDDSAPGKVYFLY